MNPPVPLLDTFGAAVAGDLVASLVLLVLVLSLRLLMLRALGRSRLSPEVKARWLHQVRALSLVVVLAGLVAIWTQELRELVLSLAALAVAFVISLKELIVCLNGSFLRTSSRAFSVGDRIQAGGVRGDVVETGPLTTTVLEVALTGSKQTGRSVVIPNSVFVTHPIVNESIAGEYGLFALRVPAAVATWEESERRLSEAAREVCAQHLKAAREHIAKVGWQKGLGPDSIEPSVSVELSQPEEVTLQVRFPAPTRMRGQVEQSILRRYLAAVAPASSPADG